MEDLSLLPPQDAGILYTVLLPSNTGVWALRTLLHHYSGDPVLRLFIPLESKSPQPRTLGPQLLPPSDLAVQASSSSSLKDSGIWALIFILLPARPQNPSSHVTFCEARARPGPGSEAGAAHPRSPAAVHLARGSCALYRPASLCPQEDLAR